MAPRSSVRLGKTYTTKTVTVSDGTAQQAVTVSRPGHTTISTTVRIIIWGGVFSLYFVRCSCCHRE